MENLDQSSLEAAVLIGAGLIPLTVVGRLSLIAGLQERYYEKLFGRQNEKIEAKETSYEERSSNLPSYRKN